MLSTLDAFILRCVEEGLDTPYALKSQAGLSLGATVPAIRRLRESGFLKEQRVEKSGRLRRTLAITAKGTATLLSGPAVPSHIATGFDADAFCRQFVLSAGRSKKKQQELVAQALAAIGRESKPVPSNQQASRLANEYQQLLRRFKEGRAKADCQILKELIQERSATLEKSEPVKTVSSADESKLASVIMDIHRNLFPDSNKNESLSALEKIAEHVSKTDNPGVSTSSPSSRKLLESWKREYAQYGTGEPEPWYYRSHFHEWLLSVTRKRTALAAIRVAMDDIRSTAGRS